MSSPDVSGSIPGLFVQCISLYQNDEEKQLFFLRLLTVVLCFQVFSFISVAQSCPTLCDPMDCSMQYFTISWSLLKLKSIRSVLPSYHLILYCPLLLPSIFPSIRVFSNESALHIRWPQCWSFSFSISPSNEYTVSLLIKKLFKRPNLAMVCNAVFIGNLWLYLISLV